MDLDDWAYTPGDLPEAFDSMDEGLQIIVRPIYNAYLVHHDRVAATALAMQDIANRGIEQDGELVFPDHGGD